MKDAVFIYIKKKYKTSPEYLWKKYPEYAVFRHADNNKWFALQAAVPGNKLGLGGDDLIEVVNVKVDDMFYRDMLIRQEGIIPAYHMNKQHWVTVLLDGSVKQEQVFDLIDTSFLATASAKKKQKIRPPKEWIIPWRELPGNGTEQFGSLKCSELRGMQRNKCNDYVGTAASMVAAMIEK